MDDQQPRPLRCQRPSGGCAVPPAVLLTYETAPITGRLAAPGLILMEAFCRADLRQRIVAVRVAGGRVVAEDDLTPLPDPVEPESVGLDTVAPSTPSEPLPEPVKVRVPRRRRGTGRANG